MKKGDKCSPESNEKRRLALKGKPKPWSAERIKISVEKGKQTKLQTYLNTPFNKLGSQNRRRRVFEEQNNSCNRCKLNTWEKLPITLELEHKDGNNKNNERENLEGLCPNCHALTPTWRGRNR